MSIIKKEKKHTQKEVQDLIIDCTEQPIQKPSKNQQEYYSGNRNVTKLRMKYEFLFIGQLL